MTNAWERGYNLVGARARMSRGGAVHLGEAKFTAIHVAVRPTSSY